MPLLHRPDRPALAYRHTPARTSATPTIIFFPGYASDMSGSKAVALFEHAVAQGYGCVLFDYAGCGQSDGAFADQTLTDWLDDALIIVAATAPKESLLLVGSSMGGWLALHAALRLGDRIAGLIGIAAAPDFTDWGYSDEEKATLSREGHLLQANPYGPEPTLTTLALWQSGQAMRLLDALIPLACPVRLLHGTADGDVPPAIGQKLLDRLGSADAWLTLVKDGDHRLSRPQDIALLLATVDGMIAAHGATP